MMGLLLRPAGRSGASRPRPTAHAHLPDLSLHGVAVAIGLGGSQHIWRRLLGQLGERDACGVLRAGLRADGTWIKAGQKGTQERWARQRCATTAQVVADRAGALDRQPSQVSAPR